MVHAGRLKTRADWFLERVNPALVLRPEKDPLQQPALQTSLHLRGIQFLHWVDKMVSHGKSSLCFQRTKLSGDCHWISVSSLYSKLVPPWMHEPFQRTAFLWKNLWTTRQDHSKWITSSPCTLMRISLSIIAHILWTENPRYNQRGSHKPSELMFTERAGKSRGWGGGSVGKLLASEAWGPEFRSQHG